ncbi:hypothetical protein [Streptomyces milbemycinicus]|uniref:hypothetical protein n=1 Tax=Streptomyces milbemycinicus TaxID=476552 RepID=UPI0033CFA035
MTKADQADLKLSYTDGRPDTLGVEAVNQVLRTVGVHISQVPVPVAAHPILEASKARAISEEERAELISLFHLDREQLLVHVELAGRKPEAEHGGFLNTSEHGVPPYPKVYDMKTMDTAALHWVQDRFGKLRPHGAFLDAEHGPTVAYSHGPEKFVIRFEHPTAEGAEVLGTNPWIDFTGDAPRLLTDITAN